MDLDILWSKFHKYEPMLEEVFQEWSAHKERQAVRAREEAEQAGKEAQRSEAAKADLASAGEGQQQTAGNGNGVLEPGHEDEVKRLREIAKERGVSIDSRWKSARLRAELGFDADQPIPAKSENDTTQAAEADQKEPAA